MRQRGKVRAEKTTGGYLHYLVYSQINQRFLQVAVSETKIIFRFDECNNLHNLSEAC